MWDIDMTIDRELTDDEEVDLHTNHPDTVYAEIGDPERGYEYSLCMGFSTRFPDVAIRRAMAVVPVGVRVVSILVEDPDLVPVSYAEVRA